MRVKIIGLSSAPDYNNTFGTVRGWDDKYGRWQVKLDYDGKTKAFKDNNITTDEVEQPTEPQRRTSIAVGGQVRIIGLKGADVKYNDTLAKILGHDVTLQTYTVEMVADGTQQTLDGKHVTLEDVPVAKKTKSEQLAVEQHGPDALTQTHQRVVGAAA